MMTQKLIFFTADRKGLTSTSADHIANMAKEMVRSLQTSLNDLTFYSTSISLIGTQDKEVLSVGASADQLDNVKATLHKIAKAYSLIAWLREAIKRKEELLMQIKNLSDDEYCKLANDKFQPYPPRRESLTEEEYWNSLSMNERNRFYELQTVAAVLGKAVHPDGAMANAREDLTKHIKNPRQVTGEGRDALIYSYSPTVEPEKVEEVYFEIQKQYREVQAKLNGMKAECMRAVKDSEIRINAEYSAALAHATNHNNEVMARKALYIKEKAKEIGAYKILIPDSLKEIYEEVNALGK